MWTYCMDNCVCVIVWILCGDPFGLDQELLHCFKGIGLEQGLGSGKD